MQLTAAITSEHTGKNKAKTATTDQQQTIMAKQQTQQSKCKGGANRLLQRNNENKGTANAN